MTATTGSSPSRHRIGPVAGAESAAIAGVVRLLCDVRLAALAVAAGLVAFGQGRGGPVMTLLILLALPFSFVPLRSWDRNGEALGRSTILLVCDTVMSVFVVGGLVGVVGQPEIGAVYAGATSALLGVVVGVRWAVPVGALLTVVHGSAAALAGLDLWSLVTASCAALGLAWAGGALGRLLRDQVASAAELTRLLTAEAATQERARLAREMHDSLAKTVHGVGLLATALAAQLGREGSRHEDAARLIEHACREANRDARNLLGGLRCLTTGSLGDAVGQAVERWSARTGVEVDVSVADGGRSVTAEVGWAVVRVLDELLDNADRHADAATVQVRLTIGEDQLVLVVTDDGSGLPEACDGTLRTRSLERDGHYGLAGVHERVRVLGGDVRVHSTPGRGVRVAVEIPAEGATEHSPVAEGAVG